MLPITPREQACLASVETNTCTCVCACVRACVRACVCVCVCAWRRARIIIYLSTTVYVWQRFFLLSFIYFILFAHHMAAGPTLLVGGRNVRVLMHSFHQLWDRTCWWQSLKALATRFAATSEHLVGIREGNNKKKKKKKEKRVGAETYNMTL